MDGGDVDWQIQQENIAGRGNYILKNSLWTDCKFIVGTDQNKKEFKAHQLFLSMTSPVFEKMFSNGFLEQNNDIHVVDIQPEAFGAMLNYMYTDKVEIESFDQACELCYIAKKYMIQNLLKQCTAYVLKDVNITNACRCYEFAKLFDQFDLVEKCKNLICRQTSLIISQPSFLDVQISTIKMILSEKQLNTTESDLFKAVEDWINAEFSRRGILGEEFSEEQQKIYAEIVPMICFLNMNAKSFADGPALSPLLKPDQSFAILLNLTTSNSSCPLPTGFSTMLREQTRSTFGNTNCLDWPFSSVYRGNVLVNTESYISFSCDKDITLSGVMVLSRDCAFTGFGANITYKEILDIYLHDWANNVTHKATFNGPCEYGKILRIYFPKSIGILRSRAYKVGVIMRQGGSYTFGSLESTELMYKSCTFKVMERSLSVYMQGIIISE